MFHSMKLGRIRRPVPANAPSLRMHAIAGAEAPPVLDRSPFDFRPTMGGNDSVGDCTCVGVANALLAQAALGGFKLAIPDAAVLALYGGSCGYVPGDPASDGGGVEVDVLAFQQRHGFDTGAQAPYAGLWGTMEPGDLNLLRVVTARAGVGYLGINLALADQSSGVWDTDTPASAGDPTPGSWGGHCLLLWDYAGTADTDLVRLATWGTLQRATWRWVRSRLEEAHCLFHRQLDRPDGTNAMGIDIDRLQADCQAFGA